MAHEVRLAVIAVPGRIGQPLKEHGIRARRPDLSHQAVHPAPEDRGIRVVNGVEIGLRRPDGMPAGVEPGQVPPAGIHISGDHDSREVAPREVSGPDVGPLQSECDGESLLPGQ
ncbi:MAG: hypothetical protein H6Q82_2274, partial [Deltaproteobacteria bacterium]|nr:hypothetical protein [Deltaproteobacteria bacterium]